MFRMNIQLIAFTYIFVVSSQLMAINSGSFYIQFFKCKKPTASFHVAPYVDKLSGESLYRGYLQTKHADSDKIQEILEQASLQVRFFWNGIAEFANNSRALGMPHIDFELCAKFNECPNNCASHQNLAVKSKKVRLVFCKDNYIQSCILVPRPLDGESLFFEYAKGLSPFKDEILKINIPHLVPKHVLSIWQKIASDLNHAIKADSAILEFGENSGYFNYLAPCSLKWDETPTSMTLWCDPSKE